MSDERIIERMMPWLRKIMSSIHGLLPEDLNSKAHLPPLKLVWEWIDQLTLKAFEVIERHTITGEGLERLEFYHIQAAIIARLVCARDLPCIRLSILETLLLPNVNIPCPRKHCKRVGCLGNQMILKEEMDGTTSIKLFCPHHKNEDKEGETHSNHPLDIILPQGPLTSLWLYWISCVPLLTQDPVVFISRASPPLPFSASTFCAYWKFLMKSSFKGTLFPPGQGRSIFVDEATEKMDESTWDRMAAVMGSSAAMWRKTYAHTLRRRQMQGGVEIFSSFSAMVEEGSNAPVSLPPSLSLSLARPPSLATPVSRKRVKECHLGGRLYVGSRSRQGGEEMIDPRLVSSQEFSPHVEDEEDYSYFGEGDGGWACD